MVSPAKIARIRERMAAAEDAQHQHQLAVQDEKFQRAISRTVKAHEVEKKREERQAARQVVREQLACETPERQAVREARRAAKAAEATKRKEEAEERCTQRIEQKR